MTYNRLRWDSPAGVQTAAVVNRGVESWGNDGVDDDWTTARLNSRARFEDDQRGPVPVGPRLRVPEQPGPDRRRAGVGHRADSRGRRSPAPRGLVFGKPNFLDRRSYPDERRIDIGDTFTISQRRTPDQDRRRLQPRVRHARQPVPGSRRLRLQQPRRLPHRLRGAGSRRAARATTPASPRASARRRSKFHTFDYDFFIQDTWRFNPRTTLNLGLRYDYEQMPEPQIPNPLLPATSAFPKDKNNFGPRLGVAYDLSGRGTSVLRGGYGMFYGRIINSTISNAITNVGSAQGQLALQLQTTSAGAPAFPNVLAERLGHAGRGPTSSSSATTRRTRWSTNGT